MSTNPGWFVNWTLGWAYNDVPEYTLKETLGRVRAGLVARPVK
jgi:hypothetical protein